MRTSVFHWSWAGVLNPSCDEYERCLNDRAGHQPPPFSRTEVVSYLSGEEAAKDEHGEGDADVGKGEEGCEPGYPNCEENCVSCLIGCKAVICETLVLSGQRRMPDGRWRRVRWEPTVREGSGILDSNAE